MLNRDVFYEQRGDAEHERTLHKADGGRSSGAEIHAGGPRTSE